jgi:hypothetical protein
MISRAQEGQRPIAAHALENLGMSDSRITMLRRLLREQIKRVEDGLDPINVVRDPHATKESRPVPKIRSYRRPKLPRCHTAKTSDRRVRRQSAAGGAAFRWR